MEMGLISDATSTRGIDIAYQEFGRRDDRGAYVLEGVPETWQRDAAVDS